MFRTATRFLVAALLMIALLGATPGLQRPVLASQGAMLPSSGRKEVLPTNAVAAALTKPRTIHAPYFAVGDVTQQKFNEMGIFWYGKVTTSQNYTDVRVGYNDTGLYIHASVIDRLFRYDPKHDPAKLTSFDSISVYVKTGGTAAAPNAKTYRFDSAMNWFEDHALYQAAYRGNGSTWVKIDPRSFQSFSGYRGSNFNNGKDNRGWAMGFTIPFASLGLSGKPAAGTTFGLAVITHDRDTAAGGVANTKWPETASGAKPSSWGRLVFGTLAYQPPPNSGSQTVTIRHKLNGTAVKDAGVGGDLGHLCDASALWTKWGGYNYSGKNSVNIQNQSDLADWPCFTKLYVSFPTGKVPRGKVIRSARLVLHEWGGSDWSLAQPSLIQVSTVRADWSEATITWNNAPLPLENVAAAWVNPVPHAIQPNEWPGWKYEWDVSAAAAEAYKAGIPLRLALYEADSAYHSGKYFLTSQAADFAAEGRPTLMIEWGDPIQ